MSLRHTVYCLRDIAAVTSKHLLDHLAMLDFYTLGEDYGLSEHAVKATRPLRMENTEPGTFRRYHLSYGKPGTRPIEIDRWDSKEKHRGAVREAIGHLGTEDAERARKVGQFLLASVDSVSVSFGIDPPATMFAWEIVRYFASQFDGLIHADDGEWLMIGRDYQAMPV